MIADIWDLETAQGEKHTTEFASFLCYSRLLSFGIRLSTAELTFTVDIYPCL